MAKLQQDLVEMLNDIRKELEMYKNDIEDGDAYIKSYCDGLEAMETKLENLLKKHNIKF